MASKIDHEHLEHLTSEATNLPVYIVDETIMPMDPWCSALTHKRLDLSVKSDLQQAGRWQGRKPAVAINTEAISAWAQERAVGDDLQAEQQALLLGAISHEMAHVVSRAAPYYSPALPDYLQPIEVAAMRRVALETPEETPEAQHIVEPWFNHGPVWLRVALHIGYRLGQLGGIELHWRQILGGSLDECRPWALCPALAGEPRRLKRVPLDEIKSIAMPSQYRRVWADVYNQDR